MNFKKQWDSSLVEVLSTRQFCDYFLENYQTDMHIRGLTNIKICKIDQLGKAYLATFAIPSSSSSVNSKKTFGFCLLEDKLLFFDDQDTVSSLLKEINQSYISDIDSPAMFLYYFLERLIDGEIQNLQEYDEQLSKLEEVLLHTELKHFEQKIFLIRKELSNLCSYYQQLSDICEMIEKHIAPPDPSHCHQLYVLLVDKIERLSNIVQMLIDYSVQLREMHQTSVDIRQNQIVQTLTIVATITMPLSLIAAWYGMNFEHMPELSAVHAYPVVCILSLAVVLLEIYIFKKKRWF